MRRQNLYGWKMVQQHIFSNGVVSGGMGANRMTRMIRRIIFKYIFCLNKYYDLNYYMGGALPIKACICFLSTVCTGTIQIHETD